MKKVIKYIQGPSYTADLWETRNPYLKTGEVGYLISGGIVIRCKVGPGYWNDLSFIEDIYDSADLPTNPLLSLTDSQTGRTLQAIIHDIITPYVAPAIQNLRLDVGAGYLTEIIKEIGQSVAGPVLVNFEISDPAGQSGASPIIVDAGGVFSNEGAFANSLPLSMTLASSLAPASTTVVTISVSLTHTHGSTVAVSVLIKFYPKLMWLSNVLETMASGAAFMALSGRQTLVAAGYQRDYSFAGNGYSWLAIPAMYGISNPQFTDVTNPNVPMNYSMEDMGTLVINNGVGSYSYQMYRSTYLQIYPTILRVS